MAKKNWERIFINALAETSNVKAACELAVVSQSLVYKTRREFFVNESLARIDMLLHPSIKGEAAFPPFDPVDGNCFVVASGGEGEWAGRDYQSAGWSGGSWTFAEPREGMVVRDLTTSSSLVYTGTWTRPEAPEEPSGGSVIDAEARTAIGEVVAVLRQFGLFV